MPTHTMTRKLLPLVAVAACVGFALQKAERVRASSSGFADPLQQDRRNAPAQEPATEHGQAVIGMRMTFSTPTVDPVVAERGKGIYSTNCSFCHGSDAAGGAVGPNLRRSEIVLSDKNGGSIAPIVHGARVDKGMPRIELTDAQIADVAGYLHSLAANTRSAPEKINIVVGDATEGKATFARMCAACHTPDGIAYLPKGVADPRAMQQAWLLPGGPGRGGFGPPGGGAIAVSKATQPTATITTGPHDSVTGVVDRIDDFYVSITLPDGTKRSFERMGDQPKVVFNDPAAPHRELLRKYSDKEIHDITAYLVTLR